MASGADLRLGHEALGLVEHDGAVAIDTDRGSLAARVVVNCAGLRADLVASSLGERLDVAIVPFRGEYHELTGEAASRVRHLVYPVPDVDLPFLGIHLSRAIDGTVHAGPNAVLALAREGYTWSAVDGRDTARLLAYARFWRMAVRYWPVAITELRRPLGRTAVARAASRLVPGIEPSDLVPRRSGVRAQVVARDGTQLDDFLVHETPRTVHVLNTPSPAATASLAIGDSIAARVQERL